MRTLAKIWVVPLRVYGGFLLLAFAAVLLLAACGGDNEESTTPTGGTQTPAATSEGTPAGTPMATEEPDDGGQVSDGEIDPCALLTKDEVEAAVGVSVSDPEREVIDEFASCDFNDPEFGSSTVSVLVLTLGDNDDARDFFEIGSEDWETVAGIGEDAYWADAPFNSLEVLEGRYNLSINIFLPTEGGDELAIAKELAAKALDRMP